MNNLIISNTCLGGFIYKYTNTEYDNPFIWCIVNDNDMLYILENYDNINFNKFELIKIYSTETENRLYSGFSTANRDIYGIFIDNKITIYFPHYYKTNEKIINERGMAATGIDIENFIITKYKDRLSRINKSPLFILETDIKPLDINKPISDNVLNMFYNSKSKYNRILLTYDLDLLKKYKNTDNIQVLSSEVKTVEDKANFIINNVNNL